MTNGSVWRKSDSTFASLNGCKSVCRSLPRSSRSWSDARMTHSCSDPLYVIFVMYYTRLTYFSGQLDTHTRHARATDLNSIKKSLADYVEPATIVPSVATVAPPNNQQRKNKDWYGWYSVWTGRLLVPRVNRDEFDEDPQVYVPSSRIQPPR